MADWRQIQARIRKAKTSSDPPAQLGELFERTRDAMVAFELAQWHERAGNAGDTVQWYTTAAQRFRRPQWRTKAEEALTRLGAPIPEPLPVPVKTPAGAAAAETMAAGDGPASIPSEVTEETGAAELPFTNGHQPLAVGADSAEENSSAAVPSGSAAGTAKRRRRGRRGGRKRRGQAGSGQQATGETASQRPAAPASVQPAERGVPGPRIDESRHESRFQLPQAAESRPEPPTSGSVGSAWRGGSSGLASSRSRAGDPGLSSRIAQLESQLRRLLACPTATLDEAEHAPAGPGVLLLSDSDQVTHYYIEACQTLRIGIGNLLRGGRGARGGAQLKPGMAEHLGINESRVGKYLKENCTARWIQLDEGAAELAHFAIAVLRPVVTE